MSLACDGECDTWSPRTADRQTRCHTSGSSDALSLGDLPGRQDQQKELTMRHSPLSAKVALAAALVALAAATSGTALALPGKHSVQRNDLARNAVTSGQVKNDSLTGRDIDEATLALGKVTAAQTADRAGNGAVGITFRGAPDGRQVIVFNQGGLLLKATCSADTDLVLTMETTVDNAAVFADTHDHDGDGDSDSDGAPGATQQGDFDGGDVVRLDGESLHSDDGQGLEINYFNPDGTEVFVKLQNWLSTGVAGAPAACFVGGVGFIA
jgi:hypothetical protein